MTLDVPGLTQQIKIIGEQAVQSYQQLLERKKIARTLLKKYSQNGEIIRQKIESISSALPLLRCALPLHEPLDACYPLPSVIQPALIIAADGSQIFPDRHAPINFYLINIGTIIWQGKGLLPLIQTQTHLFCDEHSFSSELSSSEMISLRRDVMEREALAQLVQEIKAKDGDGCPPIITLTDGTLGLWGAPDREDESSDGVYRQALRQYIQALSILRDERTISAAYIDKPRANWIVRSLEIAEMKETELKQTSPSDLLSGVTDEDLLANNLAHGERSAIFGIQAHFAEAYHGELALRFFYLNVGSSAAPWLVRVEVPAWVADDSAMLNTLHAVLWEQCQLMSAHPYPYILHRAHEAAVVTPADKEQVELLLMREFNQRGLPLGFESQKQYLKNLSKRSKL